MENWHYWIIAAIGLFIVEIFTPGFVAACLGIGCLFSVLAAFLNLGSDIQLLAFSVGSLIGFIGIRPMVLKYAYKSSKDIKSNAEGLSGKQGRVLVTINNQLGEGRVQVEGDDWKAESINEEVIDAGTRVEIVLVNSTILLVKPIKK